MSLEPGQRLGANVLRDGGIEFLVWAPKARRLEVHVVSPAERLIPAQPLEKGYFHAVARDLFPGTQYFYVLGEGVERPDPASRFQPQGVHGPSQVIDPQFAWTDSAWRGIPLHAYVFYELHVGTFTPEGTFGAIIPRLQELRDLGITAIELMPVAQFPGARNWGYDGVYPFAVQDSYGGPDGLKRLVNACHAAGMAVVLDVVYNHLGPEGNYFGQFGPYFTDFYRTPWGQAVNFDRECSDDVRRFFIENALYWIEEFHIDALRLDAVHAILDTSARPFLAELAAAVPQQARRLRRHIHLVPESNLNDSRLVAGAECGGFGLDAQWNDDFHHAVHTLLTGEKEGYYADFGQMAQLAQAFNEGFVYTGQYSRYRGRRHGNSSSAIPAERFVVFTQNHDQVGNRRLGDRLSTIVSFEALKLAAGLALLSPFLPLIFMGEEYGETAPFQYFVSHGDPALVEAVRIGRREEFSRFAWQGELPDPQAEDTFLNSRLNWKLREEGHHKELTRLYKELLRLRRGEPVLARLDKRSLETVGFDTPRALYLRRWCGAQEMVALFHFGETPMLLSCKFPSGRWENILTSADQAWGGPGSQAPAILDSAGQAEVALAGSSFALFKKASKGG